MKLKLDENLGLFGKSLLEADGHDVMTVADQQMMGSEDEQLFEVCRSEGRVLVTLDHDFGQTLRSRRKSPRGLSCSNARAG